MRTSLFISLLVCFGALSINGSSCPFKVDGQYFNYFSKIGPNSDGILYFSSTSSPGGQYNYTVGFCQNPQTLGCSTPNHSPSNTGFVYQLKNDATAACFCTGFDPVASLIPGGIELNFTNSLTDFCLQGSKPRKTSLRITCGSSTPYDTLKIAESPYEKCTYVSSFSNKAACSQPTSGSPSNSGSGDSASASASITQSGSASVSASVSDGSASVSDGSASASVTQSGSASISASASDGSADASASITQTGSAAASASASGSGSYVKEYMLESN